MKAYYSIKEVSYLTQVPAYTLRYWEKRYGLLSPPRDEGGKRRYTAKDIEKIKRIRELIQDKGYSLRAVKKVLKRMKKGEENSIIEKIEEIRRELEEILKILK